MNAVAMQYHDEHKARLAKTMLIASRVKAATMLPPPAVDKKPLVVSSVDPLALAISQHPGCTAPVSMGVVFLAKGVAKHFDLNFHDMIGLSRKRIVAEPRQIAMYLARKHTNSSYPEIGRRFNRDHTTVLHAVVKIGGMIEKSPAFADKIAEIEARIISEGARPC